MTGGVRRLSHEEAEMLISARMDEHLDRADSRALLVHLQTCEACRAFAVQTEILGRELEALPILPASAIVDRRIRESIASHRPRWSLAGLLAGPGSSNGLRAAAGALAVLALVSVYLLIRMAGANSGNGPSIDAPNGGVAQQLDRTATTEGAVGVQSAISGPTETPRVVAQATQQPGNDRTAEAIPATGVPNESVSTGAAMPTATLDSTYVYTIDKTKTPGTGAAVALSQTPTPPATEESGVVVAAAVGGEIGTPVISDDGAEATVTPMIEGSPVREVQDESDAGATVGTAESAEEPPAGEGEEPATPPAPTMTPTPVEISVAEAEASHEPDSQPPAGTPGDEPAEQTTPRPDETITIAAEVPVEESPEATATGPAGNTPASAKTPFSQPTIAPVSGQPVTAAGQGQEASAGDDTNTGQSPRIQPNDQSDIEASGNVGDGSGESPKIISVDGTTVPAKTESTSSMGSTGGEAGVGGAAPVPSPTATIAAEPAGLDLSTTVTTLPPGTTSPLGRLEFDPGVHLYAVIAPNGQLAVADLDGELVVTLGPGELPVWSGSAMMFSSPGDRGSVVGIWNSDSGATSYIPASADEPSNDIPIGGGGSAFYFLRTFPDRPGAMEIHTATIDGADEGVLWSAESVELAGARPVWSSTGILLPTNSSWLLIDADGNETELGPNPYGAVGPPVLSPGEGLMAYSAGDQVIVAWTEDPGTAVATAPFGGTSGGYAFATSGEEVVVSDGMSLHVVSYEGNDLGTLGGAQPIGGVYWISDTIYYLQSGDDAALRTTNLETIQGE